ncbi:MAG TPA: FAD-dependent oxidoreductase [Pyrinomonadaceae bacterium]|nr:FAD-dependent oxidoreductase [Pyrinomonadaceae bacterium]
MSYDVVVVGGGIGGLTVAALLSARGVKTCLLERTSQVGGCVARVEFGGYDFEPGKGLYTSFGPGEIYERVFSELPVELPETSLLANSANVYSIKGGPASVAERLGESIRKSGGTLRLNSPVLRLAYDENGQRAVGVDLLSGETVIARKAIVSNLTIWDTYGKLIGLNRTPLEIKKLLKTMQGPGVYVVYASLEESALVRLPGEYFSAGEFTVAISPPGSGPSGKRAVTLITKADPADWFAFQSSEEEYEERDQAALESFWAGLHAALPQLGSDIEIIETANPRTYYDLTRRKLGMVLGVEENPNRPLGHATSLPNVFMVGDTITGAARMNLVVESALTLANALSK